jgi:hypothetical protein
MTLKNNKTKTIFFAIVIVAMMIPISTGSGAVASAEKNTTYTKDQILGLIEKHKSQLVKEMTNSELDNIDNKIKLDNQVHTLVNGGSLTRVGYSYHVNIIELENNPNTHVDVVMNYVENGKSLTVITDGVTHNILDLQENPIEKPLLPYNGLVVDDDYGGSTINGIRVDFNSPNFTPISGDATTFILTNALKAGSTVGNECINTAFPATYWAQTGEQLGSGGTKLVWADTTTQCYPQLFATKSPATGNSLDFQIQVDSTGRWVLYALNLFTGDVYSHPQTVSGNKYFDTVGGDTNMFFENPNKANTPWAAQYNANPVMTDGYTQDYVTGVWNYWNAELLQPYNCMPGAQHVSDLETGTLKSGTLTFYVNNIASECGKTP